jgi:hypothetical protein
MSTGCYTLSEAIKGAAHYGWTPENHKRFHEHVLVVKALYSTHNFWLCLKCKTPHHWVDGEYIAISKEMMDDVLHEEDVIAIAHWCGEIHED